MKKRILASLLSLAVLISMFPVIPKVAHASGKVQIGDYIQFGSYYDEPILWRVINLDESGNPLLYAKYIIALKGFDARGDYHTDESRRMWGSNEWETSNIRQWLNSSEERITWIQNPPSAENMQYRRDSYDQEKGFLADGNFTEQERALIKPVTHKTLLSNIDKEKRDGGSEPHKWEMDIHQAVQNYDTAYYKNTRDKVFFLSVKELKEYVYDRGWNYNARPASYLTNMDNWWTWLRTPSDSAYSFIRGAHSIGHIDIGGANGYQGGGVRPAMYLNSSALTFESGAGTESDPYVVDRGVAQIQAEKPKEIELSLGSSSISLEEGKTTAIETSVKPSDVKVSYSTSDPSIATVSSNGIITARRPGTAIISISATEDGYDPVLKNVFLTVTGLKTFDMLVEPNLLILREGETRRVTSNLGTDVNLTYSLSNSNIVDLNLNGNQGWLKAKNIGETTIDFKASKEGYRTANTLGNIIVLENNYLTENIVKKAVSHWSLIPAEDRNTRLVREGVVRDSETIISSLSQGLIQGDNGLITLDSSILEEMIKEAKKIRREVNNHINKAGINPSRGINLRLNVYGDVKEKDGKISIQLDRSSLSNFKDIDYLYVYIKEYGLTVGIDMKTVDRLFTSHKRIIVEVEKQGEAYGIRFIDNQGKEIGNLGQNIILLLPLEKGNPYESSVFLQTEDNIEQMGGSYDADYEGISIQTRRSGIYYLAESSKSFTDIGNKDEEMKRAIAFLSSKGIIGGLPDGRFDPDGTLTRSQFTTMLVKSFYALDRNQVANFKDVKVGDWFHDYVASSQKADIVKGFPDQTFRPNDKITKEQMTALVSRALVNKNQYKYPIDSYEYLNFFNDKDDISNWAKADIALAVRERTIEISKDFNFDPQGSVTRGEAARTLYRMFLKLY